MNRQRVWVCALAALAVTVLAACAPIQAPEGMLATAAAVELHPLGASVMMMECGQRTCSLQVVDPMTGEGAPGYAPIEAGQYSVHEISPNGKVLAAVRYPSNERARGASLYFVDLTTWQAITTSVTMDVWINSLTFSPDGRYLALVVGELQGNPARYPLLLFDVQKQAFVAEGGVKFITTELAFSPDGDNLLLYGMDNGPANNGVDATAYAARLRTTDLMVEWLAALDGLQTGITDADWSVAKLLEPAAVIDPARHTLYVVHADAEQLTTVDFGSGAVTVTPIAPRLSWLDRLASLLVKTARAKIANGTMKQGMLSADGSRLYVVSQTRDSTQLAEGSASSLRAQIRVQVIDSADGAELAAYELEADSVQLSLDGDYLYAGVWMHDPAQPYSTVWTEVRDAANLDLVARLDNRLLEAGQRLDGRPILLSNVMQQNGQTELAILEPGSWRVLSSNAAWYPGFVEFVVAR